MSHVPIETAEEDAADLQFPKDKIINSTSLIPIDDVISCDNCKCTLTEPYITCADCNYEMINSNTKSENSLRRYRCCLKCFASGAETKTHLNTHSYIITHDNVKVFRNSDWSAREERKLLELLARCGFGNWSDISKAIGSRGIDDCRNHYINHYFDGIFWKTCGLTKNPYNPLILPYLYRSNSIDPPRFNSDAIQSKFMAGYRFARSDFDTPFDSSAENGISHLQLDDDWGNEYKNIGQILNSTLVRAYNNRLRERHRRYKIMREHGLIMPSRTKSWLAKYSDALRTKNPTGKYLSAGRFVAFMQITDAITFDRIVEGLQYEHDLRKFLLKLYELRTNGILTYQGGRVFQKFRAQRSSKVRPKTPFNWEWKHLVPNENQTLCGTDQIIKHCMDLNQLPTKRKSTPLTIIGLPNYEKLSKDEQELCSTIRVIPDAYMTYKKLLIVENQKMGYLRLADARRLIKIDVNKTRVMYDFFFEHGFISKPFNK